MAHFNDDRKLRVIRSDRRVVAAAVKRLIGRTETEKVTKGRIPELEFERELLLVAYQTLMKPALLSPAEKQFKREEAEVIRLVERGMASLDENSWLTK